MFMKIPKQIKIGGLWYEVKTSDYMKSGPNCYGEIDSLDLTINIRNNIHEEMQKQALLHEIIHGILDNAGYDEQDEKLVQAISYGLIQVITDNPYVFVNTAETEVK